MSAHNQRKYYRVQYPGPALPDLVVADRTWKVIECSESGLRYALTGTDPAPDVGEQVAGLLRFGTRAEMKVEGVVVRVDESGVAVHLGDSPVPFKTVLREQRFLRAHFLGHLATPLDP